jgi:hypothetical protein
MQLSEVSKEDVEFTPDVAWKRGMNLNDMYGKRPCSEVKLDRL